MDVVCQVHGTALTQFALKLTLGDRQRAEDIVQETLIRAWQHPEVIGDGRRPIRGWLFTVTRHVAIDMWRSRSRSVETICSQGGEATDLAEPMEQAITAMDVRAALATLSTAQRQVIEQIYYLGRSCQETAEILGIPAGTVKSRAHYGLRRLRRILSPAGMRPGDMHDPRSASAEPYVAARRSPGEECRAGRAASLSANTSREAACRLT